MSQYVFSWNLFNQAPLVGIIRGMASADVDYLLPIYLDAGLTTVEITLNTPDAEAMIAQYVTQYGGRLNIGAGTVCTLDDLDRALEAGAQFIVTPILDEAVIQACVARNVPIFPGTFSPTEIYTAWRLGAAAVKVFPATSVGPAFIRDVKAPLPQIKLLPTGGIHLDNLTDYLRAGAIGLGVGSHLFDKTLIRQRDEARLHDHFRAYQQRCQPPALASLAHS